MGISNYLLHMCSSRCFGQKHRLLKWNSDDVFDIKTNIFQLSLGSSTWNFFNPTYQFTLRKFIKCRFSSKKNFEIDLLLSMDTAVQSLRTMPDGGQTCQVVDHMVKNQMQPSAQKSAEGLGSILVALDIGRAARDADVRGWYFRPSDLNPPLPHQKSWSLLPLSPPPSLNWRWTFFYLNT